MFDVENFLDELNSCFTRSGYSVELKDDLTEFADLRSNTPDFPLVVPTFDPSKSDQSGSRFFKVTDREGEVCAVSAFKKLNIDSLPDLLKTGRIWFSDPPFPAMEIKCGDTASHVSGSCFYRGGMYVFPNHRKSGLPFGLAIYSQAIAWQEGIEWIVGQAFQEVVDTGIPSHTYGFKSIDLQYETSSYCPLKGPLNGIKSALYLLTCSRAQFFGNLRYANNLLISGRDKELPVIAEAFKRHYGSHKGARLTA